MIDLSGYSIQQLIYSGTKTLIYRGTRNQDQHPVIIKVLKHHHPTLTDLIRFRHQYTITKNLEIPGIVKPIALEKYNQSLALIMDDYGCISLKEWLLETQPSFMTLISQFFPIAIQISQILESLYHHRIIHKDIKPQNILIHPNSLEVFIIDFSISSLLPKETQELKNPNILEGTLAYISPEQTGRMNRGIDYRTDFYSLGVTFYEWLTGQLPFESDDAMELVHCHIAHQPQPPHQINPEIPQALSDIVLKLMKKTAEKRYQSAFGLRYDLEKCWQQWQNYHAISPFSLGERDLSENFVISEKLYGRDAEVSTLLSTFERVSDGGTELILVAGFSGIGKTALVQEVHKPIVRQRGYFIKGKFDQLKRNTPFAAFLQAFRDLMQQLLTESAQSIETWKTKILTALGTNGQAIIDVIPEVELLIGKQPLLSELSPVASQNRFNLLFPKFIQVFATASHPLVIFLDDLQWADLASLKLIHLLISESKTPYLCLIGAYRDNEVSAVHPLMQTISDIQKNGILIQKIILEPLNFYYLNQLIADTLFCPLERAVPLTKLISQKTEGNPFFTTQFIKSLYEENLITFNHESCHWECDLVQVQSLTLTDDVVEFMAQQLQKLPAPTQAVLKLAACIGNCFDLATLAVVYEHSQNQTAEKLWPALQAGLIIPQTEVYKFFHAESEAGSDEVPAIGYKFLHDRVQQAAYSLIPEVDKKSTHLQIGKLLLKSLGSTDLEEHIFDIVDQINQGLEFLKLSEEGQELARLNLRAGRKAKSSTAYIAACDYLTQGIQLLRENSWSNDYDLTLSLYAEATEAAYLSANWQMMDEWADQVKANATSLLDKIKVYEVKIQSLVAQAQFQEAIDTAIDILDQLGISIIAKPTQQDIATALTKTQLALGEQAVESLIYLPKMEDKKVMAGMRILLSINAASYVCLPELYPLVVLTMVNLSLEYGNIAQSSFAYANYGLILCGVVGNVDVGYKFGKLALNLLKKIEDKSLYARTIQIVNAFVIFWKKPIQNTFKALIEGYNVGIETGDLEFAGYCINMYAVNAYLGNQELTELLNELNHYANKLSQLKQDIAVRYINIIQQLIFNLINIDTNSQILQGDFYDAQNLLPFHQNVRDFYGICNYYLSQSILSYLLGHHAEAFKTIENVPQYLVSATASFWIPIFHFYDSLIRLSYFPNLSEEDRKRNQKIIEENQVKIKVWSDHCPANFLHKFYLVEAERNRVLNQPLVAMEFYDLAIKTAKENNFVQEEALANELAAKFYLELGRDKIAEVYLIDAYYGYAHWGAKTKVEDLVKQYPQYLSSLDTQESGSLKFTQTTTHHSTDTIDSSSLSMMSFLDWSSVIKASLSLSQEIKLDQLLTSLMAIALENSGAEYGVLLLVKSDTLVIEATSSVSSKAKENQSFNINLLTSILIKSNDQIPQAVINYVKHTKNTVVLEDAINDPLFSADPYIQQRHCQSILCVPMLNQGQLIGILYLENNLVHDVFTKDRLEIIKVLSAQAAICLQNAQLYESLQKSELREREKANQLEASLHRLQEAQLKLVQSEKMSVLGSLAAGIAHEINNPVNFISGNINCAEDYIQDLLNLVNLYDRKLPDPDPEITVKREEVDFEYLKEDLPQLLFSMREGIKRIQEISVSMRTFARSDTVAKVKFNVHDGINSTLLILKHRLQANQWRSGIKVSKNYGDIPLIECYPGQLNQVFMNLIANSIDAFDDLSQHSGGVSHIPPFQITITTTAQTDTVQITIEDNGPGMPETLCSQIFDHLFTTKPVGKGTGLGLSISRQIVEEKHGGTLNCISSPGAGAKFILEIPMQ